MHYTIYIKDKRLLLVVLWMLTSTLWVMGQKRADEWDKKRLDWWIGASVGLTHSLAENATSADLIHNYPGGELQLGTYFNRWFGMRLSMGLNPQLGRPGKAQREGDPEKYDTYYRFQVLTGYVDAVVDLTTLFTPRKKYRPTFSMLFFIGGGGLESFDFSKKVVDWEYYPVDYWDKMCWGAHAGLLASYRFSPHWDWMLESSYNITDSKYDGVDSKVALGGYVKIHTGFVYHFYERSKKSNVRLTTDDTSGWAPSYTEKDREKVRQEQEERLQKARRESAKRRAERNELLKQRAKEAEKANKRMKEEKRKRAEEKAEAELYNEI